jgi:hypothetical protein
VPVQGCTLPLLTLAESVREQGAVPTRDEITNEQRRLHKEELYDLDSSLTIIRGIKSRSMRWAGNVACSGERRGGYRVLWGDLKKRDHLESLDVYGRVITKLIFK